MNKVQIINQGKNYTHASAGNISAFDGKSFFKDCTGATSCEISFGTLPHAAEVPFFHSHRKNEENYIILSGSGRFQVNDDVFDISEGSVVRVSTDCDRNLKCTSSEPMIYICIQAAEGSLGDHTMTDADITERQNPL